VLDDAHSQTMVATLTSGAPTDLLAQISSTPQREADTTVRISGLRLDVIRILSTAHTAQYQYIPALALPTQITQFASQQSAFVPQSKVVLVIDCPGSIYASAATASC